MNSEARTAETQRCFKKDRDELQRHAYRTDVVKKRAILRMMVAQQITDKQALRKTMLRSVVGDVQRRVRTNRGEISWHLMTYNKLRRGSDNGNHVRVDPAKELQELAEEAHRRG